VVLGSTRVRIRPRRPDDVPRLRTVLAAQQPSSGYPFRDPLPIPVDRFLHVHDAIAAWTAERDGDPVGHVCRLGPSTGSPDAGLMNEACARAHGCTVPDLGWVATLFVGLDVRGLGVGRALLERAVGDIRTAGLRPCLEVLSTHRTAASLYESSGWREVLRLRPAWLRDVVGDEGPEVRVMVLPG